MRAAFILMSVLLSVSNVSFARILYVRDAIRNQETSTEAFSDLQAAIDQAADGDTLMISAGVFTAEPAPFIEELCGNCAEHRTRVTASRGFLIEGKALHIVGSGSEITVLITNAGYGILFLNSRGSTLLNVTITGGKRDRDGNATDAAIVAKFSTVTIQNAHIRDNTHRIDSVVVGIGGIFGREDSELFIHGNEINNNGWDGIALYRGAHAYIADNVIENGRGAGIGITWDATADVLRNRISGYWKGIGTFGDSKAVVSNNLVKDCLGWGIIATGRSYLDAVNNNVIHNGNCGVAIWSEECRGRFLNNIIVENGWKEQWVAPRVGFWDNGDLDNFIIECNDFWNNVEGNYGDMDDITGVNGNISLDPRFMSASDYRLQQTSPCRDSGSNAISEGDGSVSDMGMYGGPGRR
jgi:hypothetical protein